MKIIFALYEKKNDLFEFRAVFTNWIDAASAQRQIDLDVFHRNSEVKEIPLYEDHREFLNPADAVERALAKLNAEDRLALGLIIKEEPQDDQVEEAQTSEE